MHSSRLETFLARLFTDAEFREAFINDARQVADAQSLDAAERDAVLAIDRPGLLLAARSFAAKRRDTGARGSSRRLRPRWRQLIRPPAGPGTASCLLQFFTCADQRSTRFRDVGLRNGDSLSVKRLIIIIGIWFLSLVACAAVVAFLFVRMDVPTALHFWKVSRVVKLLNGAFGAAIVLSAESAVILATVLVRLVRGHISVFGETLAIACLTSICAYGINSHVLKVLFGVPNPTDVMHGATHNFIFWMGSENSSFHSGHMVLAGAFAGVFMRLNRASIWPLSALLLLAAGLLIVGDWHFLSDVVAGTFFGISAGILAGEGWAAHLNSEPS